MVDFIVLSFSCMPIRILLLSVNYKVSHFQSLQEGNEPLVSAALDFKAMLEAALLSPYKFCMLNFLFFLYIYLYVLLRGIIQSNPLKLCKFQLSNSAHVWPLFFGGPNIEVVLNEHKTLHYLVSTFPTLR